jgi:hypothetical protein
VWRARRGTTHRESRQSLSHTLRAAHGGVIPRRDGHVSCVRVSAELHDHGVADLLPQRAHVQRNRHVRWTEGHERLHRGV